MLLKMRTALSCTPGVGSHTLDRLLLAFSDRVYLDNIHKMTLDLKILCKLARMLK